MTGLFVLRLNLPGDEDGRASRGFGVDYAVRTPDRFRLVRSPALCDPFARFLVGTLDASLCTPAYPLSWRYAMDLSCVPAGSGPKGIRTPDLLAASQTLYQLSYGPSFLLVNGPSR